MQVPTQPSGNRVSSGSGIPRGGSNIRGNARGGARGGNAGVYAPPGNRGRGSANTNNQGGQSRPNSAMSMMNPFAQPYSPGTGNGNKRPRDESMGGPEGNGAKRGRGGGRGQLH